MGLPARTTLVTWAATAVLAGSAGCSGGQPHPSQLTQPPDTWWSFVEFDVEPHQPVPLVGYLRVCIDKPGRIEITSLSLEYDVGDLRVDAFATKPADSELILDPDAEVPTLWDYGFAEGMVSVDRVCAPAGEHDSAAGSSVHLGVQFSKPTDVTARGANLLIEYRSEGETFTFRDEFEMILCRGDGRRPELREECADEWPIEKYQQSS